MDRLPLRFTSGSHHSTSFYSVEKGRGVEKVCEKIYYLSSVKSNIKKILLFKMVSGYAVYLIGYNKHLM